MPELMTKKDAIEYLLYIKQYVQEKSLVDTALDTAIEAMKPKTVRTNGDKIRQMTDEELARVLVFRDCANDLVVCPKMNQGNSCIHSCTDTFLEWLKQEVKDDDKV